MNIYKITLFIATNLICFLGIMAQGIQLDDDFSDWENITPLYLDTENDGADIDFKNISVYSNSEYLFIRFEISEKRDLQDNNLMRLSIDTDSDTNTGILINGIGADLNYTFSNGGGSFGGSSIGHADIGLVSSPTVNAREYEIVIKRNIFISGTAVFPQNTIKIVLGDGVFNGDLMPNETGGLLYNFSDLPPEDLSEYSFHKTTVSDTRVLAYNVLRDGPWESDQRPSFRRILAAVKPDIIGFQEIYDHTAAETANEVADILEEEYTGTWYNAKVGNDIIAVSKFPILESYLVEGNGVFLVDLGEKHLLFSVIHPPCCGNDEGRQMEIDALMAFIRNAKDGVGGLVLEEDTPILIVGDTNFVGEDRQQTTLLTGNISDNPTYGADFATDWDGSDLEDAISVTTGLPTTFTWYNPFSSFSPGRLDYVVYSGSVVDMTNSYALFTPALSSFELSEFGLEEEDAVQSSDHLPIVADFDFTLFTSTSLIPKNNHDLRIFPNPAREEVTIQYDLDKKSFVNIKIYDWLGKCIAEIVNKSQDEGKNSAQLNTAHLAAGLYFCKLQIGQALSEKKIVIVH